MDDMNKGRNSLIKGDVMKGYKEATPATEMQTTVQRDNTQQRHYSRPEPMTGRESLTGAAGTASYISTTEKVIKDDTTGIARESIRSSLESSLKDDLIKTHGPTPQDIVAVTETEKAIARAQVLDEHGAVTGLNRSAISEPGSAAEFYADQKLKDDNKLGRNGRYASKRAREVKAEPLTGKEARLAKLKRGRSSLAVAGIATMKAFGRTAGDNGSDDLGIEAVTRMREAMVTTSRSISGTRRAVKSILHTPQKVKRTLITMQRTAQKAQQAARYAAVGVRASFRALSNPFVLRSLALVGVIMLVLMIFMASASSVSALFSSFTYPANDGELTDVYAYVTELDTNLEQEIKVIPTKPEWAGINEFNLATFVPKTDPMPILSYLSVKYGAFKLSEVKGEIATIHAAMYQLVYTPRTELKHVAEVLNPDGTASPAADETINHLDVTLNYTPFQTYVSLHKAEMFSKADDYAMFQTYSQVGGTSLRSELGVPFVGKTVTVSSRYGWRLDPGTGIKSFHGGIDIPMPAGTPINATMGGTITTGYDAAGFGNYVVITSGNRKTLYGHCSSLLVFKGQVVTQGQEIARVGNTGKSTGDHLHLEFEKDGKSLNPFFFIQKEQFIVGLNGGLAGAALGNGQYAAIIVEGEKYLGFPYVFGGKTPQSSFDCSGFVSWVLTHSGVKQISASAQGLYDNCTPITETELKPGDLIFFQGTYDCPYPVTHVAFYVGGDMMLQCGDPIQYASFKTSYWQNHFFAYGRVN
ncbi:MAG TPA: hypothetical protein DD730_13495 [Desulfosporosinus sp.]|jgi:murein DD-endopeptidase MepM/ murein hydrolase activator NlpD|nr:hypothetical protein [Desulfosporosinus sp.]